MKKYSAETERIIKEEVLPKLGYSEYNKDNIGEISEYIFSELEGPLADLASSKGLTKPKEENSIYTLRL